MTGAPRQARPRGHDPRINGDPTLSARLSLCLLLALGLLVRGLGVPAARAQDAPAPPPPPTTTTERMVTVELDSLRSGDLDSLLAEKRRYSRLIASLRDSLEGGANIKISEAQKQRFEHSIEELSRIWEQISAELGDLEFQIKDNTISWVDPTGEGVVIRIPEELSEGASRGLEAVTQMVLQELPDTLRTSRTRRHTFVFPGGAQVAAPHRERVIEDNVIKVGDDLFVGAEEVIRGHVVVVGGSVEILGRVDGNVVVVFGDLRLDRTSEVTGTVVTVGGRKEQQEGARVGDVVVVDPFGGRRALRPTALMDRGWRSFLVGQALFVLMLAVATAAAVGAPRRRFDSVLATLRAQPLGAAGSGLVVAVGGHLVLLVLVAVLVLTVIGLPLALLLVLAMLVAGVVATAVVAAAVGDRVCGGACSSRLMSVFVGMVLLHLLSFVGGLLALVPALQHTAVFVSALGLLVKVAAYVAGLGALVLARFGAREPTDADAATVPDTASAA